ncbi:MAG: serine protease [Pirellulales bacterium]
MDPNSKSKRSTAGQASSGTWRTTAATCRTRWHAWCIGAATCCTILWSSAASAPCRAQTLRPDFFAPQAGTIAVSNTPHPAVVRVVVPENGGTSYGSGTLIDVRDRYGLVITNWHVVRDSADEVEVIFPGGFRSKASVLKVDSDWDLAALVIWRPEVDPVSLADRAPQPGELLTIAGYGQGEYRQATGRCTQYVAPGMNFPYEMVELSTAARQGDSGGPIFNEQGELAGVLFGAGHGTTSGSYCGRVAQFLTTITPDVGHSNETLVAENTPQRMPPAEVNAPAESEEAWRGTAAAASQREALRIAASQQATSRNEPAERTELAANPPARSPNHEVADKAPPPAAAVAALSGTATAKASNIVTWHDLAGESWFDQAKTILALVGSLALVVQAIKLTASE